MSLPSAPSTRTTLSPRPPSVFIHSVIKTRMQSLEARQAYRNSFHCAYRIFTEEGLLRFWTGTTPRLARLVVRRVSPVPLGCFLEC